MDRDVNPAHLSLRRTLWRAADINRRSGDKRPVPTAKEANTTLTVEYRMQCGVIGALTIGKFGSPSRFTFAGHNGAYTYA